jgi:ABC-2 type transport system ATP-binding protein
MGQTILRTEKLSKTFEVGVRRKRVQAVKELDLAVEDGEIFGFVGPNGAGKTTTIKMLMGLIFPTSGRAFIYDAPIPSAEAKRRIGFLPENPSYHEFLTGKEALRFFGQLSGVGAADLVPRIEELLELVGITDAADRQIRKYSKGMQQRLGIAQALVGDPSFVVLDEPMSGLDPIGRKDVRDLILELKRRGKTVLFSTHIRSVEVVIDVPDAAREAVSSGKLVSRDQSRLGLSFADLETANRAVAGALASGGALLSMFPHRETLEDFFVRRLEEDKAAGRTGRAPEIR